MKITVLSGGVGGARFTRGLLALVGTAHPITVIANTGDDMWLHGVRVCPDLDTLMYTLGGAVHEDQGWGRRGESTRVSDELAGYGLGWDWFTLGDLDLATHLARTELLRAGLPLSQVTARLAPRWRPGRHAPAHDGRRGRDARGARRRPRDPLRGVVGAPPRRRPGRAVRADEPGRRRPRARACWRPSTDADVVVLPPSNPVVSVGTILAIPGVRDALTATGPRSSASARSSAARPCAGWRTRA